VKERAVKRYPVVITKMKNNYAAGSPDVDGCVATAKTLEQVRRLFKEALELHLQGTAEDGDPIPEPVSIVEYVEVEEPRRPAAKPPAVPPKPKRRARDAG
jgi:predicted RNase H-like HicB family nuclease